jgi:uncharacterized protein YgiM (DUF1202 family)
MKRMRPLILLALALIMLLPMAASAQTTLPAAPNPFANITFPPPIYVLSGQFQIIGSANLPNMSNYFIEFRPIPEDVTIPSTASWAPATVPSRRAVQDDVLGVWDTNTVDDGAYEIRLTVNIRGGQPVQHVVTPLRVENNPRFGTRLPPATATPTSTPIPAVTSTPTPDPTPRATVSAVRGNVRGGDSTDYPILATLNQGQTVLILGISSRGTGWYQVRLPNGTIGWMAPSIVTVSGNLNLVPFVPPPPLPPTATPAPTATTPVGANLVAGLANVSPFPPVCNQPFTVGFDVANQGTAATFVGGTVLAQVIRVADNSVLATTTGTFPALGPGVTTRVNMTLTVGVFFNELHRLVLTIDPNNQVQETTKADNIRTVEYVLQPGACGGSGTGVNLVAGNMQVSPFPPVCNQSFTVIFDVANLGTAAPTSSFNVTLEDVRAADGSRQVITSATLGPIQPGQTVNVGFNLTISTWFNETHRLIATIDPENAIPETNEGDNQRVIEYVLQQGGCS